MNCAAKKMSAGMIMAAALCITGADAVDGQDNPSDIRAQAESPVVEQAAPVRAAPPAYTVRPASGVVRDLQIRGRVQSQFGYVDASNDEGSDTFSTFEVRRARIGLRGTLFDGVRAQIEANVVPGSGLSMRSAFLQWRDFKPAYIKLGYDKPLTSIEENTSSAEILTVERTLVNGLMAAPGPLTGLSLEGAVPVLSYGVGLYTDTENRNKGGSDPQYLLNAMAGLHLDALLGGDYTWKLQAHYQNSDDDAGKTGAKWDSVATLGTHLEVGRFDLRAEVFLADADSGDTTGWYVMPSVYLTGKLQAVARLEQADSDNARGLRAPSRYLRDVPSLSVRETTDETGTVTSKIDPQAGDAYQSVYLGLNYYLAGNGHKLMLGVERARLENTDAGTLEGTTFSTAWRMLF